MSGWDRKSTLIDPMCGSGTIAIEAALWAADIPAMIERSHFAFKNFKSFDAEAWEKVKNEGNQRPIKLGFDILASDIDGEMVKKARRNSRMAPIGNMVTWDIKDALDLEAPDEKGIMICNPPYGERMGEEVEELYTSLGDLFKQSFLGYDCWVVSSNIDALKNLGLRPSQKIKVFNGNLECSLRQFQIFAGTKKYDNSEEEEDGTPAKPRGVRREKRIREEKVVEEHINEEASSTNDEENSNKEENRDIEQPEKKEYSPTRRVISTPESTEPRKSAASKYGQAKSSYLSSGNEEEREEKESSSTSSKKESQKDDEDKGKTEKKEYNPTRKVISSEPSAPRESAASKYGQAKSAYLPAEDINPSSKKESKDRSEEKEEQPVKKSNKTDEPRLGAAKYNQTPKFSSRYTTDETESKDEEVVKDETSNEKLSSETTDEKEELSLKEKIEQMKKSRKEE
jgi:16S rRNA G966 N2-methylase RsmD